MTVADFVTSNAIDSAGGTPTNDNIGFTGSGLVNDDKVIMFVCYNSFAFASIEFPDASENRTWFLGASSFNTYGGAGPFYRWKASPFLHRYDGDDSNLRLAGNSPPDMIAWLAYRDLPTFTNDDVAAPTTDNSTLTADTLTIASSTNYCGGGINLGWLVFCATQTDSVITWPAGVTERLIYHDTGGTGTIAVAEEVNTGGNWPARSVSYTGGALGAFGGVSLGRYVPLFRQDGDT